MSLRKNKGIFLILIFILAFWVRIYKLSEVPGEWYGDISNVHEYMMEILQGKQPFYFFQSNGPVYHYLILPFVLLFRNQGYETYKYSSVAVSFLGLWGIYLFVKELSGRRIAYLTTIMAGISLWYLVWSRLGNSQIVIPGIISFSSFFLIRYLKFSRISDLCLTIAVTSLGWYTYPQTFILTPLIFIFILFYLIFRKRRREFLRHSAVLLVVTVLGIVPFILIIINQNKFMAGNFGASGYVGEKILPVFSMKPGEFWGKLGNNLKKTYLMLHLAGDRSFRVNVAGKSQIDGISGILFIFGLIYMIRKMRRDFAIFIILSLLILPLPSVSPAIPEAEIPNSARTIAIVPFVFLLVSLGFWQVYLILTKLFESRAVYLIMLLFMTVAFINLSDYFKAYAQGLPQENLGPSRIIASYIDKHFPSDINLYFAECCWGDYGEPEPKGIAYNLRKPGRHSEYSRIIGSCKELDRPAILIFKRLEEIKGKFNDCIENAEQLQIETNSGENIARMFVIKQ